LIFYTGSGSDHANAAASIEAKKSNSNNNMNIYKSKYYSSFIYYLILALNHIDFHWGVCKRWVNLNTVEDGSINDFNDYKIGNVVTWI